MKMNRFVAAAAFAALLAGPRIASADDDPTTVAAARTIGLEGLQLAEAGKCKEAVEKLDRAEKLHHAPTTLGRLGECNVQIGHLVVGIEQLRRLVREPLAADAPAAFLTAKSRAQKVIDETQPRIAQLHVTVQLPPGVTPQVTVDGEPVPPAMLGIDRPTDPGGHTVSVIAPGYKKASQMVSLKDGERVAVELSLEVDPAGTPPPVAATPASPSSSGGSSTVDTTSGPFDLRTVGWVLVGVGGAGIATGVIAGALGLGTKSKLDDSCDASKRCDGDQEGRLDRLKTESTISTVGFVVGGLGLAGGAAILLFGPKPRSATASSPFRGLDFGLGSVGYRGTF